MTYFYAEKKKKISNLESSSKYNTNNFSPCTDWEYITDRLSDSLKHFDRNFQQSRSFAYLTATQLLISES